MDELYNEASYDLIPDEMKGEKDIPVFLVTTFTNTPFGKLVRATTHSTYSHSAIGFNPNLESLYSYGMQTTRGKDGISAESLSGYVQQCNDALIYVGMVMVTHSQYNKIRKNINLYLRNIGLTSYNTRNIFNVVINKPGTNKDNFSMICSQFVDGLFKMIGADLTGKDSSISTPYDLRHSNSNKIIFVYEGLAKDYDVNRTNKLIKEVRGKFKPDNGKMEKLVQMHKMLNTFKYGIVTSGGKFIEYPSPEQYVLNYRYLSPERFYAAKGGVCWDYAEYQYRVIKKLGYKVMNYYIELINPPTYDTHTFTVVRDGSKYLYIESSFQSIKGIYISDNIDSIFEFVVQEMMKQYPGKTYEYFVTPYPGYSNYGCTCEEFMEYMCSLKQIRDSKARYYGDVTLTKVMESAEENFSESVFISKDNLELNLDKWMPGRILWITGSSGDGKSTLANKMVSEKNGILISTDVLLLRMAKSEEKFSKIVNAYTNSGERSIGDELSFEFIDAHPELPFGIGYGPSTDVYVEKPFQEFFAFLMEKAATDPRVKTKYVVVEGCAISFMDTHILVNEPLIIMGCSRLRGFIQRYKRERSGIDNGIHKGEDGSRLKTIFKLIRKYSEYGKDLDDKKWRLWNDIMSITNESSQDSPYEIEKEWGITGPDGAYNAYVKVKGIDKPLRGRSEMLIIKGDSVFIKFKDGGRYDVPGGSWEKNESHRTSAIREAMEEARIICKNVEYADTYTRVLDEPRSWVKDMFDEKDWYYGTFTELYIGEYDKKYTGHIDDVDKDAKMLKEGKFYPIKSVMDKLYPVHRKALTRYLTMEKTDDDIMLESFGEKVRDKQVEKILKTLKPEELKWWYPPDGVYTKDNIVLRQIFIIVYTTSGAYGTSYTHSELVGVGEIRKDKVSGSYYLVIVQRQPKFTIWKSYSSNVHMMIKKMIKNAKKTYGIDFVSFKIPKIFGSWSMAYVKAMKHLVTFDFAHRIETLEDTESYTMFKIDTRGRKERRVNTNIDEPDITIEPNKEMESEAFWREYEEDIEGGDSVMEKKSTSSTPEHREKVLNLALKEIESTGRHPNVDKKSRKGWIDNNDSGDFHDALCIASLGRDGLDKLCSQVNKVIKPEGAIMHPDNYGTAFISMTESVVTESYATNYIANKVKLWSLGKRPEITAKSLKECIKYFTETYSKQVNTKEVKELKKDEKKLKNSFYQCGYITFPDGMKIEFHLNFDENEFTPGAATDYKPEGERYPRKAVLIYPGFFKETLDEQVFTLLHEIGHIRLGHTKWQNSHRNIFGQFDGLEHRRKLMNKGKVMYPELNADLYAALSGAKLYTILSSAVKEDYDKKYDYRYTNNEMANRYIKTFDSYIKLRGRGIYEAVMGDLDEWDDDMICGLFNEAATDSHIIINEIYPIVANILKTPVGDKRFRQEVEAFVDKNSERLHEPCPISMIAFTDMDKAKFYTIFEVTEKQLKEIIARAVAQVSSTANFLLVKKNPIFSLFYCVLRYYTLANNTIGINATLIIHALASYPSIFSKYFKYGANAGVMKYTADNLTEKFIFKQEGHVFGALKASITSSYTFLKPFFRDGSDKEVVRYIQRIRNDQNSMIKKIYNEYDKNYRAGNSITTQNETYDTGALIDDMTNDTSKVEVLAQKVLVNMLSADLNLKNIEIAARFGEISMVELRLYLTKIITDVRTPELEDFITSVLFIYLYNEKKQVADIHSKMFISFGMELFRKTNSNDKNVRTIKMYLDKWSEETGIHEKFRREGTRNSYKKGIFWYILLSIQMLS